MYLALRGYRVIGVDVSAVAVEQARELAAKFGVTDTCQFLEQSLGALTLRDEAIDGVIGFASLHHFIKYPEVAAELHRVVRRDGVGFFADSFGENPVYRLFHDREAMSRLGDVVLTKKKVEQFFVGFKVSLKPTDWFVMLDKLWLRLLPSAVASLSCV